MKAKIVPDFLAIVVAAVAADKGLCGRVPVSHSTDFNLPLSDWDEHLHHMLVSLGTGKHLGLSLSMNMRQLCN